VATGEVILVLGGTRSGKSAVAERFVTRAAEAAGAPVTYVAAGRLDDGSDAEWSARVAVHRSRRPRAWATREIVVPRDLPAVLRATSGAALVDSLGTWLARFDGLDAPAGELADALRARVAEDLPTVVVSEEVGLGVHPLTAAGRSFADSLGELNQAVATIAGRVVLVVAGRELELGRPDVDAP
jgi:adenosyl cobinamide kinase/adenosyl cobinamide phosphate guanylyltransferase